VTGTLFPHGDGGGGTFPTDHVVTDLATDGGNSPTSAPQSSLKNSIIVHEHHPIRACSPAVWGFRQGQARILTASQDGTARLWDSSGRPLAVFRHNGPVSFAAFSPDGTRIVTVPNDRTARVWRIYCSLSDLIERAESLKLEPLTSDERRRYFLE
jgi:WD40 repeat protein